MASGLRQTPAGKKTRTAQREAMAVRLAAAGLTYEEIAEQIGVRSAASAWKCVDRALKRNVQQATVEYRALHETRLTEILRANWQNMLRGETKAARVCLDTLRELAKLNGLWTSDEAASWQATAEQIAAAAGLDPAEVAAQAKRILDLTRGTA